MGIKADLLRWTAGSITGGQIEETPKQVDVVLGQVGLESRGFVESVSNYSRNFFTMVGQVHRIEVESERRGYRRRLGQRAAQRLYRRAAA